MTTQELTDALRLDRDRIARVVHDLCQEGCVDQFIRKATGFSFRITETGQAVLDRLLESWDGVRRPRRPDPLKGLRYAG